jgi:hypothetical protein
VLTVPNRKNRLEFLVHFSPEKIMAEQPPKKRAIQYATKSNWAPPPPPPASYKEYQQRCRMEEYEILAMERIGNPDVIQCFENMLQSNPKLLDKWEKESFGLELDELWDAIRRRHRKILKRPKKKEHSDSD